MSKEQQYQIDNITRAVLGSTWLCHLAKLEEMKAFLEFRASGGLLEEEVVKQAFLPTAGSEVFSRDGERIDVDGIRYIPLFGVMAPRMNLMMRLSGGTSTHLLGKDVRKAITDDSVKTVLMHVDSPGGVATMIPEVGQLIRENRDRKRIVVVAEGIMASGALWVGTAGTEVLASTSTDVGSQGAYSILSETTEADAAAGIKYEVIRSGEFKAIGNSHEKLTESGREEIQRSVDEMNQMFVAALAANRGVTEQFVRDRFGRGKIFSASDAVDRKMIDGVMVFEEVLERERHRNSSSTTVSIQKGKFMKVTQKVKAAMFAQGCIDTMDASDKVCTAFLRGRLGEGFDGADEQKLIRAVMGNDSCTKTASSNCTKSSGSNCGAGSKAGSKKTGSEEATTGIDAQGNEYATVVQDPDRFVTRDQVEAEQRARRAEISLAAKELNIPEKLELEAFRSNKSVEDCIEGFKKHAEEEQSSLGIVFGDASQDKMASAITGAILERCGQGSVATKDERSYARS